LEEIRDYRCLLTLIVNALVAWPPTVSVTLTVKRIGAVVEFADVGIPRISPGFNDKPSGRVPLTSDHVYDPVPPVAASGAEYGRPTLGLGRELV
jgi:hypothetical protein